MAIGVNRKSGGVSRGVVENMRSYTNWDGIPNIKINQNRSRKIRAVSFGCVSGDNGFGMTLMNRTTGVALDYVSFSGDIKYVEVNSNDYLELVHTAGGRTNVRYGFASIIFEK